MSARRKDWTADVAGRLAAGAAERRHPTDTELGRLLDALRHLVHPELRPSRRAAPATEVRAAARQLERLVRLDLNGGGGPARARAVTQKFFAALPDVAALIALDVAATVSGDPAASGPEEVVLCYPGVHAIAAYRLAHALLVAGARLLPRRLTELAHARTGIDIHPGARIGRSFLIDHGTGVVVGETCIIGDRVRVYQGVTLGALSLSTPDPRSQLRGKKRHPTLGDDVIVYANATILGGDTIIAPGTVVGGNAWIIRSPEGAEARRGLAVLGEARTRSRDGLVYPEKP
jgi:serine O-acetyltransferase